MPPPAQIVGADDHGELILTEGMQGKAPDVEGQTDKKHEDEGDESVNVEKHKQGTDLNNVKSQEENKVDPIKFKISLRFLLCNFAYACVFAILLSVRERRCESSGEYTDDICYGEMVSGFYIFYYILAGILLAISLILGIISRNNWNSISNYAACSNIIGVLCSALSGTSLIISYFTYNCQCPDSAAYESCKLNNAGNESNCDPCIPYPCELTEFDTFTLVAIILLFFNVAASLVLLIIEALRFGQSKRVYIAPVRTDVFLTHDWGTDEKGRSNHARVSKVNQALKKRGLVTWFDEERMDGNIRRRMVEGIENTKCVVVFITRRYRDKVNGAEERDNCRYEFTYAIERKGPQKMLAVVMEESMLNSRDWAFELGAGLGAKLYVSLTDDDPDIFDTKCQEIYFRVMNIIKAST